MAQYIDAMPGWLERLQTAVNSLGYVFELEIMCNNTIDFKLYNEDKSVDLRGRLNDFQEHYGEIYLSMGERHDPKNGRWHGQTFTTEEFNHEFDEIVKNYIEYVGLGDDSNFVPVL